MGILDNLENAWDGKLFLESNPMPVTDNMGREQFWEDLGRPESAWSKGPAVYDSLTLKLFSETCCTDRSCKNG